MANHKSAIKRIKQAKKRTERNRYWRTTMRTYIKRVRGAVAEGDATKAQDALTHAVSTIDKCRVRGVIHKNQASRRISRLTRLVNGISA